MYNYLVFAMPTLTVHIKGTSTQSVLTKVTLLFFYLHQIVVVLDARQIVILHSGHSVVLDSRHIVILDSRHSVIFHSGHIVVFD